MPTPADAPYKLAQKTPRGVLVTFTPYRERRLMGKDSFASSPPYWVPEELSSLPNATRETLDKKKYVGHFKKRGMKYVFAGWRRAA